MEIQNLFHEGGSPADLRHRGRTKKTLRNSRENSARRVYIRLVTI